MPDNSVGDNAAEYEAKVAAETERLQKLHESVKEALKDRSLDDPETMKVAKETALDLIPDAAVTIRYLMLHAESESVRKDLSKWIFTLAMDRATNKDDEDELQGLIDSLTGGKAKIEPDA